MLFVQWGPFRLGLNVYLTNLKNLNQHLAAYISWWRHQREAFSALLALCAGNSPVPVNSRHKVQWRGALMFSLICVWINGWVNNREAADLRRPLSYYDVRVMGDMYWYLVLLLSEYVYIYIYIYAVEYRNNCELAVPGLWLFITAFIPLETALPGPCLSVKTVFAGIYIPKIWIWDGRQTDLSL